MCVYLPPTFLVFVGSRKVIGFYEPEGIDHCELPSGFWEHTPRHWNNSKYSSPLRSLSFIFLYWKLLIQMIFSLYEKNEVFSWVIIKIIYNIKVSIYCFHATLILNCLVFHIHLFFWNNKIHWVKIKVFIFINGLYICHINLYKAHGVIRRATSQPL